MSAIFNFQSLLVVILLAICTCTYIRGITAILDRRKTGFLGTFWKFARIGERKSPWIAAACVVMAISDLIY